MTDGTPTQGTGISGAAQQFEAMMAAGDSANQPAPNEESTTPEADEAEVLASDTTEETPSEAPEGEDEGAVEEEATAEEEAPQQTDPLDQIVTVKVDGKEQEVTLREALNGYSRTADYSRKTMELAEQRKAMAAEFQAVQEERQQYAQLLTALSQQLQAQQPQEPNWEKLYNEDPLEYVRQKDLYRERQEKLVAAQIEMQRVTQVQEQEAKRALADYVNAEKAKLFEVIPQWKNEEVYLAERGKLREYGNQLGFSDEELSQAYDHRAVTALYKAMKYDQMMANKPKPAAAQPGAPKAAPAGGQTNVVPKRSATEVTRAKQRLAKTGRVQDAASIFETLL